MDPLNDVFDSLNRSLSAFDPENPIWAATASLIVALLAYGVYRLWRRFVRITSLDDFFVSYEVNAYTRQAQKMSHIYSELHGHIVHKFKQAGIEIMSPHYSAIRDGNPIALPKDHLPKNYEPTPFTVQPLEGLLGRKKGS